MRKINFNNRYGLTNAVRDGLKTMTRRIVPQCVIDKVEEYQRDYYAAALECISVEDAILNMVFAERMFNSAYRVGEVVAVAQSYKDCGYTQDWVACNVKPNPKAPQDAPFEKKYPGWSNKLFVCADLMPIHVKHTAIKVERLQNISDEDCIKEGIWIDSHREVLDDNIYTLDVMGKHYCQWHFPSPKLAFATLIDKVSGKGTWGSNPYVFAYTFEIVKQ